MTRVFPGQGDAGSSPAARRNRPANSRRICTPKESHKKTQREANYRALVEKYPAHEFIIDLAEAESLGLNVCEPDDSLSDLFDELRPHLDGLQSYIGVVPQLQLEEGQDDEAATLSG